VETGFNINFKHTKFLGGPCERAGLFLIFLVLLIPTITGCSSNGSITSLLETEVPTATIPVTPLPTYSLTVCDPTLNTQYGAGDGTSNYPYLLCNVAQWRVLQSSNLDWGKYFKLADNLDFVGVTNTVPVGNSTTAFTGTFDGDNKTISNLTFGALTNDSAGIFGVTSGATIKNIVLNGVSIDANGHSYVGALIGMVAVSSSVTNIAATGITITNGLNEIGGLIGRQLGILDGVSVSGSVTAIGNYSGGLVGYSTTDCLNFSSEVKNSSANVAVSGNQYVGGVIGYANQTCSLFEIKNISSAGLTQATGNFVGGALGYASVTLTSISATGSVVGGAASASVGGLIGTCVAGIVSRSVASGAVTGGASTGGFVGSNEQCTIIYSLAKGNVSGVSNVGGFAGSASSSFGVAKISFCYAQGSVAASAGRSGGFVGYLKSTTLSYSYASGVGGVTGTVTSGGLVGFNDTAAVITLSYFDKSASALTAMCGTVGGTGCNDTYGKTTVQMQTAATYAGSIYWNFIGIADGIGDEWKLAATSYPQLFWEDSQPGDLPVFSAGSGTSADPYVVTTAAELNQIGYTAALMNQYFKLGNNIDLSSLGSYPMIGDVNIPFVGSFDGNGKTLSNLTINKPAVNYVGLFSYIEGGSVRDLTATGFSVTGSSNVGLIAGGGSTIVLTNLTAGGVVSGVTAVGGAVGLLGGGYTTNTLANVITSGSVTGSSHNVGGLIGYSTGRGDITSSSSSATVVGLDYVGGLVGYIPFTFNLALVNSFATGNVSGRDYIGGVVGETSSTITDSYASGNVSGRSYIGGIAGDTYSSSAGVIGSHATGNVTASSTFAGGLVGYIEWHSRVGTSYATGSVTGTQIVGGLAGRLSGYLQQSYATGSVLGDHMVGGLVGSSNQYASDAVPLRDCYAVGSVTGRNGIATQYLGGVIGYSQTNLDMYNLYYAGTLTKGTGVTTQAAGGIVGYNQPTGLGNFTAAFWDQILNPTLSDIGGASDAITNHAGISGATTAEMKDLAGTIFTGAGWDFSLKWSVDTSVINGGYPILRPDSNPQFN
jgi:hypothetical protein